MKATWNYGSNPHLKGRYLVTLYDASDHCKNIRLLWWDGKRWPIDLEGLQAVAWMPISWPVGNTDAVPEESGDYLVQTFGPGGSRVCIQHYNKKKGWGPFEDRYTHVCAWDKIPELA